MTEERLPSKFTFILHADIAGSTALVQQDEDLAHKRIRDTFRRFSDLITKYHGHVRELRGDALLAEFERASDAVTAALAFQADQSDYLARLDDNILPTVRVGIAMGEVIIADDTITGEGVVLAQRVEQLAEPGGVCITGAIQEALPTRLPFDQSDLGEQQVKGFDNPVHVYSVQLKGGATIPEPTAVSGSRRSKVTQFAIVAAVVVLICGAGLLVWLQPWKPDFEPVSPEAMAQPLPAKPSIAVLPFDDLSTGEDQGYLSDAISEGIITELSQFSELFVIARNSSFQYRDKSTDVRDIAAELGVHYVLEGSQQKDGDRLRVTVQLIDALAGNHIWAESYDRSLEDLFAVQDEIVQSVASTAGAKMAFRPPPTGGLDRLSALHHHLKARQYIRQWTKEGTEKARLENLAAIEADPTSPFGYIGLTFVYLRGYQYGWTDLNPDEALERARQSAEKALELDPSNYDTHYARAYAHVQAGEQDQAIARYEKSIDLNPSATNVIASLAEPLVYTGRVDEAIELLHRAMRLDPHHPDWFKWSLAWAQWTVGECDAALSTMLGMAKIPNMARRTLATIYVCLGRQEEASATITKFLENEPDYSIAEVREKIQRRYKDPAELERWIDDLRMAGLPENPPLKLPDKPSIAVLPFTNMSDDPQQEYFVDGMTEDLITDLSKISGLFVIARNSSFTYKGKAVNVKNVARDLGVRYVLEGSVRRAGSQVRINAQLVDATTGGHLWAERYDGSLADVFALQDRVTRRIVDALSVTLTPQEIEDLESLGTANVAAHDAYLQGLAFYVRNSPTANAKAEPHFQHAIELDPQFGRAYSALAQVYFKGTEKAYADALGISSRKAAFFAYTTLAKSPDSSGRDLHAITARASLQKHQLDSALHNAELVLASSPNDIDMLKIKALVSIYSGHHMDGRLLADRVVRLDPALLAEPMYIYGLSHFADGSYDEAAKYLERALQNDPSNSIYHRLIAATYGILGRQEEAREAMSVYRKSRSGPYWIAAAVYEYPFEDERNLKALADGFETAGLVERPPARYLKLNSETRLTGAEIEALLTGRTIKGSGYWRANPWSLHRSRDGMLKQTGGSFFYIVDPTESDLRELERESWIERNRLCHRGTVLSEMTFCVTIHRDSVRGEGHYYMVTDTGPHPF